MNVSLRLNEEDSKLICSYAKANGITISELFRQAVLERIQDEIDLQAYDEAYAAYLQSGKKSRPIEELWKELNL